MHILSGRGKLKPRRVFFFLSLPDRTVYDMDSGSYFVPYNSFKQTRTPVIFMYYNKEKNTISSGASWGGGGGGIGLWNHSSRFS